MTVRGVLRDTRNILRDSAYSLPRKAYWLVANPFFHIEKWKGVRLAARAELTDTQLIEKYSLEKSKKTT